MCDYCESDVERIHIDLTDFLFTPNRGLEGNYCSYLCLVEAIERFKTVDMKSL